MAPVDSELNTPGTRAPGASYYNVLLAPWSKIYVFFALGIPAIVYAVLYTGYSIYMDRRGQDNINHSAHLWGAAYGVLFTVLVNPRVLPHFLDALLQPRF